MKFDSYHPTINFMFFTAVILCTICFDHPVFVAISYLASFAYSVKLNGRKAVLFDICLIPLILLYAGVYSYYNHFGITPLRQNFIGNSITLEAFVYGIVLGVIASSVIMWASCIFAVFSTDKIIYLFGRISPKLSLFISIILRSVPRIKERAHRINVSRSGIGRGVGDGNVLRMSMNVLKLLSALVTWVLENFVESTKSMKCRGYSLKGRTAFSIYRFDNRDRTFVIVLFAFMTITAMAVFLDQVFIYYNPEIVFNRITGVSYIFYIEYAAFMIMPMLLQIVGEKRFEKLSKH